mgnify:CR=1 FL=1
MRGNGVERGPRASIALIKVAKAHALLSGRSYVSPHDVKTIAQWLKPAGYATAIQNHADTNRVAEGLQIAEFTSLAPLNLFPAPSRSLGLPIAEP